MICKATQSKICFLEPRYSSRCIICNYPIIKKTYQVVPIEGRCRLTLSWHCKNFKGNFRLAGPCQILRRLWPARGAIMVRGGAATTTILSKGVDSPTLTKKLSKMVASSVGTRASRLGVWALKSNNCVKNEDMHFNADSHPTTLTCKAGIRPTTLWWNASVHLTRFTCNVSGHTTKLTWNAGAHPPSLRLQLE